MRKNIEQVFKGSINGVHITSTEVYNTIVYILNEIEKKFGEVYTDDFVKDIKTDTIRITSDSIYTISFEDVQEMWSQAIMSAPKFEDIELEVPFSTLRYDIERIQKNITAGAYNKDPFKNAPAFSSRKEAISALKGITTQTLVKINGKLTIVCPWYVYPDSALTQHTKEAITHFLKEIPYAKNMGKPIDVYEFAKDVNAYILKKLKKEHGVEFLHLKKR